jgi:ribosome-associated translation inhibitor RaiA
MRIDVHGRRDFGDQTRAYAEYRVFSMLKNFGGVVRHVSVTLAQNDRQAGTRGVVCRVRITLTNDRHLETRGSGRHPYGAIDRVAERIRPLMATIGVLAAGARQVAF